MAKIKKNDNIKCWQGYGKNCITHILLVGIKNCVATPENSLAVSYKIKH